MAHIVDCYPSVNVHVASVSAYIPSAETTDCAPPSEDGSLGTLASNMRQAQFEAQKQDAQERTTVWDAEKIGRLDSLDVDAEFEDDPDFPQQASHDSETSPDEWVPMGIRTEGGHIVPSTTLSRQRGSDRDVMDIDTGEATQELLFTGRAECVPDCVQHLVRSNDSLSLSSEPSFQNNENAGELSVSLPPTQKVVSGSKSPERSIDSLPPSDFSMQGCSLPSASGSDIDTQLISNLMKARMDTSGPGGEEILSIPQPLTPCSTMGYNHVSDTDTQPTFSSLNADTIESFPIESPVSYDDIQNEIPTSKDPGNVSTDANASDGVLDCDCHVSVLCDDYFICLTRNSSPSRWMTNRHCVKADAKDGTIFGRQSSNQLYSVLRLIITRRCMGYAVTLSGPVGRYTRFSTDTTPTAISVCRKYSCASIAAYKRTKIGRS